MRILGQHFGEGHSFGEGHRQSQVSLFVLVTLNNFLKLKCINTLEEFVRYIVIIEI